MQLVQPQNIIYVLGVCVSKYTYVLSTFYKNTIDNWKKLI